jgi:poly [ADP-ribose] polymerase 10/14/15
VLSQGFAIAFREYMPFVNPSTNALAMTAHWQIIFAFFVALLLTAAPISINNDAIGVVLLLANIAIFVRALREQLRETKAKQKLHAEHFKQVAEFQQELDTLRKQVAEFQQNVLNIVVAQRAISMREHRRFMTQKWPGPPAQMTTVQLQEAAAAADLDTLGVLNRHELERYLQVSAANEKQNLTVYWYWAEDPGCLEDHNPAHVLAPHWVRYTPSVSAQLEYRYSLTSEVDVVAFDVNNRVISDTSGSRGKKKNAHAGTAYAVDMKKMKQTDGTTGFERDVLRKEEKAIVDHVSIVIEMPAAAVEVSGGTDTVGSTVLAEDDAVQIDWSGGDDLIPPFPYELSKGKEPLLLLRKGQLLQVQKKRADGWWYGFVVPLSDSEVGDFTGLSKLSKHGVEQEKKGEENEAFMGDMEEKTEEEDSKEDEEEEALQNTVSGWFPSIFTSNPSAKQLAVLQKALGGEKEAVDALAPPRAWSKEDIDPAGMKLVEVDAAGDNAAEYKNVVDAFMESLPSASASANIVSLERIQNLALWQSYAAKKQTLLLRGGSEGIEASKLKEYEKPMLFHGTSDWASAKIMEQGFNRMFCGKNATAYGKGVYFAVQSSYSASNTYSPPASDGIKRMFVCCVLAGEICMGKSDQLVPDERKPNQLYDSTTDNMTNPSMYITYHDAQAYPAYLIRFKNG